jgi:hypothetical protein
LGISAPCFNPVWKTGYLAITGLHVCRLLPRKPRSRIIGILAQKIRKRNRLPGFAFGDEGGGFDSRASGKNGKKWTP